MKGKLGDFILEQYISILPPVLYLVFNFIAFGALFSQKTRKIGHNGFNFKGFWFLGQCKVIDNNLNF